MAKYPCLTKRGATWQVRKRVPADLQHMDRRGSVRKSLNTQDRCQAIRLYPAKLAEIEAEFDLLRQDLKRHGSVGAALATSQLYKLTRSDVESLVERWWERRRELREPSMGGRSLNELLASLDEEAHLVGRAQHEGRDYTGEVVDRLLVDAGIATKPMMIGKATSRILLPIVDRTTPEYGQLRSLVEYGLKAEQQLARDFATGERLTPAHPIFNPQHRSPKTASVTVGELIRQYRHERERLRSSESTSRRFNLLFRAIGEVWGEDLPAAEIDRARCVELVDFLHSVPSNAAKKFPNLTLREASELAKMRGSSPLKPNTIESYVNCLRALLRWAKKHKFGVDVDTSGLVTQSGAEVERRGFYPEELSVLFSSLADFRTSPTPHKFWVPDLGLYTGARLNELCQLHTEDVIQVSGIACLNLSRFDVTGRVVRAKRFKNKYSERFIPLHDELLAAGFMEFVGKADPDGRLFPEIEESAKGFSHKVSKWFGRFMSGIGLTDPSLVFHSFRHGFRDACRDAEIAEDTALALGGWAAMNQGQKYGKRGAVPRLDKAMKRIGFGSFRLVNASDHGTNAARRGRDTSAREAAHILQLVAQKD